MKQKYPKAELMLYYRRVNYTINSGYKKYYFDNNANITNIHINGYDNKATNCEFWGMLPDNTQIACYYYKKSDGTYVVLNSLMYENELIKDKVSIFNKNGISRNEDLALKTSAAVLKSETNAYYDKKNINQSQVNTKEANDWKKEVKNKTYIGFFQEKYILRMIMIEILYLIIKNILFGELLMTEDYMDFIIIIPMYLDNMIIKFYTLRLIKI